MYVPVPGIPDAGIVSYCILIKMLNNTIKVRLNRRRLEIVDVQSGLALLPERANVRPSWAKARGSQTMSCLSSGTVSERMKNK